MARATAKIRLYVTAELSAGASVALDRDQARYLFSVMRLVVGDDVLLFNGADGEWRARIIAARKKDGVLEAVEQTKVQMSPPDLWLMFAPIKKARTDFIAEKATEMGARRVMPVFTRHTNSDRVNAERLAAHCVEAAEQCGLVAVPDVLGPQALEKVLADWPGDRRLMFCDETAVGGDAAEALRRAGGDKWGILIGPEGGFSADEITRLRALPFATPVSLGPRILRADTAAVAALTIWQATLGDWA